MRKILFAACVWVITLPVPLQAQSTGWPNLDQLIFPYLTRTGRAEASFFLPDDINPDRARRAVGIVYEHIEGSAGSTSIAVGLFVKPGTAWQFAGVVPDLYGRSPREAAFSETTMELTTTMLGPNEPRCCPTMPVRWRIDLATLTAQRLN